MAINDARASISSSIIPNGLVQEADIRVATSSMMPPRSLKIWGPSTGLYVGEARKSLLTITRR
jgi:hypothetical protein